MSNGITVTEVVHSVGSVWLLRGIEHETDKVITFGADARQAAVISEALEAGEDVEVFDVEDWQIMHVGQPQSTG